MEFYVCAILWRKKNPVPVLPRLQKLQEADAQNSNTKKYQTSVSFTGK